MDTQKRNEYESTMTLNGIDTVSGYGPGLILYADMQDGVKTNISRCNYQANEDRTYLVINPNKSATGERLITAYSQFMVRMAEIFDRLGNKFEDFDIIRADFCLNSTDQESYGKYQKLHRLLLSCLAKAYSFQNVYVSCDLWDFQRLSLAIKKDDCEAENYNKYRQSDGTDESANRLEIRSKRMSGTSLQYQFLDRWFKRLDAALEEFGPVQQEYNDHLAKLYKDDLDKPAEKRNYLSLDAFLLQYKECIYKRAQLIDLLGRFDEVKNPRKKADRFLAKHQIEFFSQTDLDYVVRILKKKIREYFNS